MATDVYAKTETGTNEIITPGRTGEQWLRM